MKPYFYIIRHKHSGIRYAGSRWAVGCDPSELLQEGGYNTSSKIVNDIISKEGSDVFVIDTLITLDDPYEYETRFLKENKCASSVEWYNLHDNSSLPPPYGSKEYKNLLKQKYGVEHNTHIPEVRAKMTASQKMFYKNNPDKVKARAQKIADIKIKNGTTGKGKVKNISEAGRIALSKAGKWPRSKEHNKNNSERQKLNSSYTKKKPMNKTE